MFGMIIFSCEHGSLGFALESLSWDDLMSTFSTNTITNILVAILNSESNVSTKLWLCKQVVFTQSQEEWWYSQWTKFLVEMFSLTIFFS